MLGTLLVGLWLAGAVAASGWRVLARSVTSLWSTVVRGHENLGAARARYVGIPFFDGVRTIHERLPLDASYAICGDNADGDVYFTISYLSPRRPFLETIDFESEAAMRQRGLSSAAPDVVVVVPGHGRAPYLTRREQMGIAR